MGKQLVRGILASLTVILAFSAPVQATDPWYDDAISINLYENNVGFVSSRPTDSKYTFPADNWINMTILGKGKYANLAVSRATADGSGLQTESFTTPVKTAEGVDLSNTPFGVQLSDGGWGKNSSWDYAGTPSEPVATGTLGRQGIRNGEMPNGWGPTDLVLTVSGIPSDFTTAGYDLYVLAGPQPTNGGSINFTQTWLKVNTTALHTGSYAAPSFPILGIGSMAAIQILKISGDPPTHMTATPGSGVIDFGVVPPSTSWTKTIALANDSIADASVTITDASFTAIDGVNAAGFAFSGSWNTTPRVVAKNNEIDCGIQFNGPSVAGNYGIALTITTDTGKTLAYDLRAAVALPGDTNCDRQVSLLDYNIVKVNFGNAYTGDHWRDGDVNQDGQVGLLDYNLVKAHFGKAIGNAGVTAVPEPATFLAVFVAAPILLGRNPRVRGGR